MKRNDRQPAHKTIAGARVDYTDPLFEEHTRAWLSALFETYPDAVDLYFWNAEGYGKEPDHESSEHMEVMERYRPEFAEAKRIFEKNWLPTCAYVRGQTVQEIIDTDIIQMEATLRVIAVAWELRPDFTVSFGFLFRGYVLQSIDRIVDKDIPFIDFQSSAVIPIVNDINAQYCAGMGERNATSYRGWTTMTACSVFPSISGSFKPTAYSKKPGRRVLKDLSLNYSELVAPNTTSVFWPVGDGMRS